MKSTPTFSPVSPYQSACAAKLELRDGTVYNGYSFGASKNICGEIVFQTGMVGYVESLTDPSFTGQILVLTYPLIGNYGAPDRSALDSALGDLPKYFESNKIHVAGLVVAQYSQEFSHYLATSSLGDWLKENDVPAIYGVDTRSLTKKLRNEGVTLGKLYSAQETVSSTSSNIMGWIDPNESNLVAQVSIKEPKMYEAANKDPNAPLIIAVDVGMKYNQIRCLSKRNVRVKVVQWDFDFNAEKYDGLFISNGPGDPIVCKETIINLKKALEKSNVPIFGICLGHQLLALAAGASTEKLKFGNRGQNIPCIDKFTNRCYITSQNHGYAVQASTLPAEWKEYFMNANDGSNEGIIHVSKPFFSVQFHPEANAGPKDTEFLFDKFVDSVKACLEAKCLVPFEFPTPPSSKRIKPKRVLILGSGGLSIGQAGEFDYSGSQAIKALKEEGIYTILINPNIATIQTSQGLADKVYFLPVTPDFIRKVIQYEHPDAICVSFGGQTALNAAVKMKDEFEKFGVQVLGTPIDSIILTEDRELFARKLAEINEKCARSFSATTLEDALKAANSIEYPVICRAAYTLGGLGSGFADNDSQLIDLCKKAFASSPQVLIEKSMKGWKEIEYEVVRDAYDNCITVCNMENFDPLGIHTGDSIVVCPSQTLTDTDYQMLRSTAINVIRHLGIVGECNIQYALDPESQEYCIIEVNARLSRSSALASKATGYPLAFVAAKLGLGMSLAEIKNSVTKTTVACFEPSLDYCVIKIPRWDLKKFRRVSNKISSAMKSVGEVMAIGRCFEECIQKAIRSVDYSFDGFCASNKPVLDSDLSDPSDERLFAIANAMHQGYSVERIWMLTKIDRWFLKKLQNIVNADKLLSSKTVDHLSANELKVAKMLGFSDRQIAGCIGSAELTVRKIRLDFGITPVVKQIDTVSAEFPSFTNYLYRTYSGSDDDIAFDDNGIIVLGSGVYRIGSSVEFDWCAVRSVRTLRASGFKTIMINYNPETVSTDFDEADRLYFENIDLETVEDIYHQEKSIGVIVSMGGQTPNNIALRLFRQGVKVLGTSPEQIDNAENRYKFSRMLDKIGVDQPRWKELTSFEDAKAFCDTVAYPVLVRPSYVLSGAAMNVVFSEDDLCTYLTKAAEVSKEHPVVISKYIEEAKEIEMDAVALNGKLLMHIISEHVENAGVHSGDATLILPSQDLDPETVRKIEHATTQIADSLDVTGPFNIQFIAKNNEIKVIECNVRASRSFPFVSKVLGVDMIEMCIKAMLGIEVTPYPKISIPKDYVAVKVPQFSFARLSGADPVVGVDMASTGEVVCFGKNKYDAYIKSLMSTGFMLPKKNILISIGSYKEKNEFLPAAKRLVDSGYNLFATMGTGDFFMEHGIPVKCLELMDQSNIIKDEYNLGAHLANNLIDLYICLPSRNNSRRPANYVSRGYITRRMAVDFSIPLITNIKCAKLFVEALCRGPSFEISSLDYKSNHQLLICPGLIDVFFAPPEEANLLPPLFVDAFIANPGVNLENTAIQNYCVLERRVDSAYLKCPSFIDMRECKKDPNELMALFNSVASVLPIITNATGSDLAAILLCASLKGKALHITNVFMQHDLELIKACKMKGLAITCDVAIFNLLWSTDQFDDSCHLGTYTDILFLWNNLDLIDCFSTGDVKSLSIPLAVKKRFYTMMMPMLITAMIKHNVSFDILTQKMDINPRRIFTVAMSKPSFGCIEIDRPVHLSEDEALMLKVGNLVGHIDRVVFDNQVLFIDGTAIEKSSQPQSIIFGSVPLADAVKPAPAIAPPVTVDAPLPSEISYPINTSTSAVPFILSSRSDSKLFGQHVTTVNTFTRASLRTLFDVAHGMNIALQRGEAMNLLRGKVLANLFYEASTRTSCSFQVAMMRLGGNVITVEQATSSISKGESLEDTVRTLSSYADAIVIRSPVVGSAGTAAKFSKIPVINAGDGAGEHPTQALLDIFTIREELGTVNGLHILFIGDLKNGRTVHSLVKLLSLYDVKLYFFSPDSLSLPTSIIAELMEAKITYSVISDISQVISSIDVIYTTRIQKERFHSDAEYESVKSFFVINNQVLSQAKANMIVMHPLPRVDEISPEVDIDPRAAYFRQMKYGLYVRMALLYLLLADH